MNLRSYVCGKPKATFIYAQSLRNSRFAPFYEYKNNKKKNKGVNYIKKIKVVRKMKIKIHIILTILYGLYTSSKFIDYLSSEKHINILTVMVYFGNILITFMIYKLGEMLGKWLSF